MEDRPDYLMVDLTVIAQHDSGTGIQRMVRSVWRELSGFSFHDMRVVPVATFPDIGYCYLEQREDGSFARAHGRDGRCAPRNGDFFLGLDLNVDGLTRERGQLMQWRSVGVPIWLTVYDLIPIVHPSWFKWHYARRFRKWFNTGGNLADGIICISDHVARLVENRIGRGRRAPMKSVPVCTVLPGSDLTGQIVRVPPSLPPFLFSTPFVLMVGTIEPRKGYTFALKIFKKLWSHGANEPALIIVGKPGWKTRGLQRQLKSHRRAGVSLFWFSSADDGQLAWLYDNASLLLAASRDEGFGLPIAEALARALPVLANDIPPFREFDSSLIEFVSYGDVDNAAIKVRQMIGERRPVRPPSLTHRQWKQTSMEIVRHMGLAGRIDG